MHSKSLVTEWAKGFSDTFDLSRANSVLDLGCRDGVMSTQLADHYPAVNIDAIDSDADNITKAKPRSNLTFEQKHYHHLETENTYDAVVSFSALHWVSDKQSVLLEIYRALKPGGKLYLQFFAHHGRPKNDRFLFQTAAKTQWRSRFKHFLPDYDDVNLGYIASLLTSAGFLINHFNVKNYDSEFECSEQLMGWLGTWASHIRRIPKKQQKIFLFDAVSDYMSEYGYSDASAFPYREYLLELVCEKPFDADRVDWVVLKQNTPAVAFWKTLRESKPVDYIDYMRVKL